MVTVNVSYPDFTNGEVSPRLAGRYDLQAFYKGGSRVENFISEVSGSASYRNGLIYVNGTKSNNKAFLYTFEFSDALSFVLEFTAGKIRFYRDNGIIESGGSPYEVTTTYAEADLFGLKFAQNGLSLYIVHPNYPPKKLTYISSTNWTFATHAAYESEGSVITITGITKSNPAVVTYSGADNLSNGHTIFIQGVNGMVELNDRLFTVANVNTSANTFELSGENSSSYVAYVSDGTATHVGDADFLTAGSYPSCVTFYEQRLVYAGFKDLPATIKFSATALPDNFVIGTDVDDAIEYTVSGDGNNIIWLRGTAKFLGIGTYGDVLQATGGIDGVITPTSISVRPSNGYGVADINPVTRGSQVIYMQRNRLIMRSFEYDFQADSYVPIDRNTASDHITASGVTQLAFQEGRPNIIWAAKTNGELIGMTMEEQENISGWHRHSTQGEIISITSTPRDSNYHQLWVCVKRGNNYYIEYMADPCAFSNRSDFITGDIDSDNEAYANVIFEEQKQYIHLDSCLSYYGDSVGLDAGATLTPAALSGSSVTFTASASVFTAGMVGRELWKKHKTGYESGRAVITGYTSGTVVTCEIIEDFDSTSVMAAGDWYLTAGALSGINHLEGYEVSIVSDGGQHPQRTVSGGAITLDRQASVVHVGLSYTGYLATNDLEGGSMNGTSQTKKKSVVAIGVRLLNSLYCKVGTSYYTLDQIEMRTASMPMDRPPLIFNGDVKKVYANEINDPMDGGWSRQKKVIICQDQPYPCNVQLIVPYMDVS